MLTKFNLKTLLLFCLIIPSCSKNNNFTFKGAYPDWEYMSTYNEQDIIYIKANDPAHVDFRNRIYVTIDTSLNILLNNHPLSIKEFEKGFEYVYTNPDELKNLPESPEKAVVLFAINRSANFKENLNPNLAERKVYLDASLVQPTMLRVIQEIQEEYVKDFLAIELGDVNDVQQTSIEQKFPLNIAIYSIDLEEKRKKMNSGITSKIPLWGSKDGKLKKRNVITVLVNDKNEVYLQDKILRVEDLTKTVKKMILNPEHNPDFPENPMRAIVSLRNDRKTDYDKYLEVYNALKKVYTEMWEEKSQSLFGKSFDVLNKEEIRKIKKEIPFVLSEAEPTDF